MTNHDLVKKVIGKISPVGESNEDAIRFENLKAMCQLAESILYDIDDLIHDKSGHHEASIKRSVEYACQFMNNTVKNLLQDKPPTNE